MASHDSESEEDLEIARILDERRSKNATKSKKKWHWKHLWKLPKMYLVSYNYFF